MQAVPAVRACLSGFKYSGEERQTADKCRQCLLCAPVCPDSSIPVKNGKRLDFDYDHCKGCGICAKACPFGAITMKEGIEA